MSELTVAGFYLFAPLSSLQERRCQLLAIGRSSELKGTILLADEGVNGTVAGRRSAIEEVLSTIRDWPGFSTLDARFSMASSMPFARFKVRIKQEIVTIGTAQACPNDRVGRYLPPDEWDEFTKRDDVVLIDTRNAYETKIGSFEGAVDPALCSFGEFPSWWQANKDDLANKKIAMFCTGGIRCEKATSYLLAQGVEEVAHLKGGILAYLDQTPKERSTWNGECFVFDKRVSLTHGLQEGTFDLCPPCGMPLQKDAKRCPNCGSVYEPSH